MLRPENNFCQGPPPPVKGKFFNTRFGLIHAQTGKKNFCRGTPPPSKGKIFWHQIWLDTCSDREKKFLSRDPPLPSKGKKFWPQIWLDTCSDWEKKFLLRDPPSKGEKCWHQIWLDTCSDWEKKILLRDPPPFPRNSKDLLWLRGGRYASCVHAGGLSCFLISLPTFIGFRKGDYEVRGSTVWGKNDVKNPGVVSLTNPL